MDPVLYHTHHSLRSEDLPFWRDLGVQSGGPVLELGCGTGRVLLRMMRDNLEVVGLDNDPEMLVFLNRMIPPTLNHMIEVIEGDMRTFELQKSFPLVTLPCNTLSSFTSEDRRRIFTQVHRHLTPQGVFAFSIPNPLVLTDLPEIGEEELEDEFTHPATQNPVRVFSSWERSAGQISFFWRYEHVFSGDQVTQVDHTTAHHLDPPQTYIAELKASKLKPVAAYGDFYRSKFSPDASYFIVLATQEG